MRSILVRPQVGQDLLRGVDLFHRISGQRYPDGVPNPLVQDNAESDRALDRPAAQRPCLRDTDVQRVIRPLRQQLMRLHTRHHIRGFDADHNLIISAPLDHPNLVKSTLDQSLRRHAAVFFHQIPLQGTGIDTDADWYLMFLRTSHHGVQLLLAADIARIDPDFVRPILHCRDRHAIVKMNVGHQRNMNALFDLSDRFCRRLIRHRAPDDLAASLLQPENLRYRRFHVFRGRIRHRLNENPVSAANRTPSDSDHACMIPVSHVCLPAASLRL